MKRYKRSTKKRNITIIEHGRYRFRIVDRTKDINCHIEKYEVDIDRMDLPQEQQFVGNGWGETRREAMLEAIQCVRLQMI